MPMMRLMSTGPSNGGWKTTMSCRAGSENRHEMRSTSTRSPISSVFSMDSEGMRYGLTRNAWMSSATAMATTASTTYSRMVRPVVVFLPPLPCSASAPWVPFISLLIRRAGVYQSARRRESGQYVASPSPTIAARGTVPQSRLSSLSVRLSPMTK